MLAGRVDDDRQDATQSREFPVPERLARRQLFRLKLRLLLSCGLVHEVEGSCGARHFAQLLTIGMIGTLSIQ